MGKENREGHLANKGHIFKQITTVGNWCLILLRNFGRQYRTYALKLSPPKSTPDQDGNIGGSWICLLQGHTKYTATQGAIFSERNTETNWVTPTYWVAEKLTSKSLRKAETHSHIDLHHWHNTIWSEGNHQLPSSPWRVKGLDHMSSITAFKTLNSKWACIHESHSIIANKADFKWVQEHPPQLYTQDQCRGSRQKHHLPISAWKEFDCVTSQLLPEGPASNQPACRCWMLSSPSQILKELALAFPIFSLWLTATMKPRCHLLLEGDGAHI